MFATIYVQKPLKGYPMIESMQVADSKWNESSTGHVSFYMQKSDPVFANIKKKNQVSALFSNETQQFNNETSQMEKTGYRVLITGFVAQVCNASVEWLDNITIWFVPDSSEYDILQWYNGCHARPPSGRRSSFGPIEYHFVQTWNWPSVCVGWYQRSILLSTRRLLQRRCWRIELRMSYVESYHCGYELTVNKTRPLLNANGLFFIFIQTNYKQISSDYSLLDYCYSWLTCINILGLKICIECVLKLKCLIVARDIQKQGKKGIANLTKKSL